MTSSWVPIPFGNQCTRAHLKLPIPEPGLYNCIIVGLSNVKDDTCYNAAATKTRTDSCQKINWSPPHLLTLKKNKQLMPIIP